jgi:hypothetical protein
MKEAVRRTDGLLAKLQSSSNTSSVRRTSFGHLALKSERPFEDLEGPFGWNRVWVRL